MFFHIADGTRKSGCGDCQGCSYRATRLWPLHHWEIVYLIINYYKIVFWHQLGIHEVADMYVLNKSQLNTVPFSDYSYEGMAGHCWQAAEITLLPVQFHRACACTHTVPLLFLLGCTGQSASVIIAIAKWLKPPFTYVLEHSIENAHL